MLIGLAGLIVAFFALLSGGPKADPLIVHMDKYAKKVVLDKDRLAEIKEDTKAIKSLSKAYNKQTKKYSKELSAMYAQRETSTEDFQAFFDRVAAYEREVNEAYFPLRVHIQNTLGEEEWKAVIEGAQKDIAKDEKRREKTLAAFFKDLEKAKTQALKAIDDPDKSKEASAHLDAFIAVGEDLADDLALVYHRNSDVMLDQTASQDDLMSLAETYDSQYLELLDAYVLLHNQLVKTTTDAEWKKVVKKLSKL
jgi:hypothetical protein